MKKVHAKNNLCRPVVHGYEAKRKEAGVALYTSTRLVELYPDSKKNFWTGKNSEEGAVISKI